MQRVHEHVVLRAHHVAIAVVRELRVQAVAGLGRLSVPDAVGDHDEVLRRVEQPVRHEQLAREPVAQELVRVAAGPVQDQHCVVDTPARIPVRRAERDVVQPKIAHRLAVREPELRHDVRSLNRVRPRRGHRGRGREPEREYGEREHGPQQHAQIVTAGDGRVPSQDARSVFTSTCVPSRSSRRNSPNRPNASANASCLWIDS